MHPGKSLAQALSETSVASLIDRCERAEQAARHLNRAARAANIPSLPALRGRCQIRDRRFLILVTSASQAAKLRQSVPRLLQLLREGGFDLSEIRIHVQPGASDDPPFAAADRPHYPQPAASGATGADHTSAAAALAFAEKLALTLKPSPLQGATVRLAETLKRQLAHRG